MTARRPLDVDSSSSAKTTKKTRDPRATAAALMRKRVRAAVALARAESRLARAANVWQEARRLVRYYEKKNAR